MAKVTSCWNGQKAAVVNGNAAFFGAQACLCLSQSLASIARESAVGYGSLQRVGIRTGENGKLAEDRANGTC